MLLYIARRLIQSFLIVIVASFFVYVMMAYAGDPLEETRGITNPTERQAAIDAITNALRLDVHPVIRYFGWLGDVLTGDFGLSARSQLPITDELKLRLPVTMKLVGAATILSIVGGVGIGIVTALRQYTAFDYIVTFFTFVFFSLPVFWVAVILKDLGGIRLNDWLRDGAEFSTLVIVVFAVAGGVLGYSIAGGPTVRRAAISAASAAGGLGLAIYLSSAGWFLRPGIGLPILVPLAIGIGLAVCSVFAGLGNRKALYSCLTTSAIGIILYLPLQTYFDGNLFALKHVFFLAAVAIAVGLAVGYLWGGYDKWLSARASALVAVLIGIVIFIDRMMQSWEEYSTTSVIRNRPIKTIGDRESRLEGSFWVLSNDVFSHLVLPTITLMLISLAGYTRYARASMLETLNQDYMRTARAKGLTERTVVVRHGLRNALIPIATIVAFDIGGLLGGAVITESVFEWNGMGSMFIDGLRAIDPNPVMAFFVVVGVTAVLANLLADIIYSVLDPRIRLHD